MAGKRYAILIAASKFPEEPGLTELRCPENDVDALKKLLISPDFGQFDEVIPFKNAPSYEILERIETVLHDAGSEDLVLIYFSGHGKLNASGQLCLATVNTKLKVLGSTSIKVESVKSFFDAANTRKRILILDCCYSGAAGAEFVKGGVDDQLQLMSGGQGTFIMTASTAFQIALEKEGDSNGLFTKHLLEGIRSGEADKDDDGLISVHELYEYVHEKVQAEGAQVPMKWGLQTKGSMIIAKSGRDAKEKRRQELRAMLYNLASQGWLSDSIVSAAVHVIFLPDKEMTAKDRECLLLIEQLADKRISTGDFVERWVKTCSADKQEGDKDTHSSRKNLWNWLIHDVLADLLLRFVFAAFILVIGWRDLKQWESHPETKQTASSVPDKQVEAPPAAVAQPTPELPSVVLPNMAVVSVRRQTVPSSEKMPPKDSAVASGIDSFFGRFHALVIGNQNYKHLTKLKTPVADAKAVTEVLGQQYGFTVDLLLDETRTNIMLALAKLRRTMTSSKDNLLIYYAGHGYLDEATGTGYWQPVDAESDNDVYWIPTDEITHLLKAIQAKHVLVVMDSCYSGSLLTRGDSGAMLPTGMEQDEWMRRMQYRRSRTVLTSGGEEPVADGGGSGHSVFAQAFIEVLRENKKILDGQSLFDRIKRLVAMNAKQTPYYGNINMTGHDGGDFILVPKDIQVTSVSTQEKTSLDILQR